MKIGVVAGCNFIDYPVGGTLYFIRSIMKYLNEDLYLIGITTNNDKIGRTRYIKINGKKLIFIPFGSKNNLLSGRIFCLINLMKNKKIINKFNLDALYIHSPELVTPFLLSKKIPIVFQMHGATNPAKHSRFGWARKNFIQRLYDILFLTPAITKSDEVIAINDECMKLCMKKGRNNCIKIPVCVDTNKFQQMDKNICRKKLSIDAETVIMYSGRLGKAKGLELLINGFKLFNEKYPNSQLFIIGDGEEKSNLKFLCKKLELENSVEFKGFISNDEMPLYLNSADTYIMTSYNEGTPLSLLEAMACGLPAISTNVGGISEVIQDKKNGILIEKRDPQLLASKITEALNNKEYLGDNAILTVKKNFSAESIADRIQRTLKEILTLKYGQKGNQNEQKV